MAAGPEILTLPACTVDLRSRRAVFADREERLTARDVEVLRYFATHPGELVTRPALERDIWKLAPRVRSEAVPVAIRRIRSRIERDPRDPEALVTDYGHGWRLHLRTARPPPAEPTRVALIGREDLLADVEAGWATTTTTTLVGPGGVGKTTLARAASPPGSVFVDLQAATTRAGVVDAIQAGAASLDLAGAPPDGVVERVRAGLADVPLVVLDNAEQALDPVRWLLDRLPGIRTLVTSRERLGNLGERVVLVPPLPPSDARALFVRRYQDAGGRAELDPDEVDALVEAVASLPLAIELVAPRARLMALGRLRERITGSLDAIPTSNRRTARHASIRACLDWSWDALEPEWRDLLRVAATFAASFSFEDLEAVSGADPFDALEALVERSLVVAPEPGRFQLLVLVRTYTTEQGIPHPMRAAHAEHVLSRANAIDDGPDRRERITPLLPELVQIVRSTDDPESMVTAGALVARAHYAAGLAAAARDIVDEATARLGHSDARLELQRLHATARLDAHAARRLADTLKVDTPLQRLEIIDVQQLLSTHRIGPAPDLEDWRSLLFGLDDPPPFMLGTFAMRLMQDGSRDEARTVAERAVERSRVIAPGRVLIRSLRILAAVCADSEPRRAEQLLRESLRKAEQSGERSGTVVSRWELARIIAHRDRRLADEAFAEAVAGLGALSGWPTRALALATQATNAFWLGEADRAFSLFQDVDWPLLNESHQRYFAMFRALAAHGLRHANAAEASEAIDRWREQETPSLLGHLLEHLFLETPLTTHAQAVVDAYGPGPWPADITTAVERCGLSPANTPHR